MNSPAVAASGAPAVRIEGLGMVYPGGVRALEDVNLEVREGEFLAILGLSGSGKSTLLRCINRLIDPTEGRVWIFGTEITALSGGTVRIVEARPISRTKRWRVVEVTERAR